MFKLPNWALKNDRNSNPTREFYIIFIILNFLRFPSFIPPSPPTHRLSTISYLSITLCASYIRRLSMKISTGKTLIETMRVSLTTHRRYTRTLVSRNAGTSHEELTALELRTRDVRCSHDPRVWWNLFESSLYGVFLTPRDKKHLPVKTQAGTQSLYQFNAATLQIIDFPALPTGSVTLPNMVLVFIW